jgi:hypothetical protein
MSVDISVGSPEVEQYCDAVRVALADVPEGTRADLLEDLPEHLLEVLAEGDGSLQDRLGTPADYARELRSVVGLDWPETPRSVRAQLRRRLSGSAAHARQVLNRGDQELGRVVGYPRLADLVYATRPGWWVLRGWIAAQLLCGLGNGHSWRGLIPAAGSSKAAGAFVAVVAVIASVWLGRGSRRFSVRLRAITAAATVTATIWALLILNGASTGAASYVVVPASSAVATTTAPAPVVNGQVPTDQPTG